MHSLCPIVSGRHAATVIAALFGAMAFGNGITGADAEAATLTCQMFGSPVEYCGSFFHLDNRGPNGTGRATGERISLGFTSLQIQPFTIDTAVAVGASNPAANIGYVPLNFYPFTYIPLFHHVGFPDRPARRSGWDLQVNAVKFGVLTIQDDVIHLPSLAGEQQLPVIQSSVTMAGKQFSWQLPTNVPHDAVWIGVIDRERIVNGSADRLISIGLPPGATSINLNTYSMLLEPGHRYTLEVGLANTRSNTTNIDNPNLIALSRAFYDFVATSSTLPVVLPVTTTNNVFQYNMPVVQNVPIRIDPELAVGYEYQIGAGDPLFGSVRLPNIGDDDGYTLCLWMGGTYDCSIHLDAGELFEFLAGADRFKVVDIDPGLDPTDPTAFVTELTFLGEGRFTGTQTPIVAEVPEPLTLTLFATGLLAMVARSRVRAVRKGETHQPQRPGS